ncbi:PepSY-associated TM helix domain-containing protein [Confluentibacter sediminis]|uniref:PepSY-associated TM helix domain-containing protein n=1 Tax=Confluentibacter sediminis TaxID=2219045 RepID=UPI000DAC5272|nr:PepSY-associated TM helix domain-containing protein [Confluentibacter sediminis]
MTKKFVAKYSRWLHIYLSMISFVIVLFFSITGLTLNHADYFQNNTSITQNEGKIDSNWISATDTLKIKKLEIVEFFRNKYKVKGSVTDFRIYDSEISLTFKAPGYASDIFINREDASFSLTQTNQGLMGFFNDLHKGRDTGKAWLWTIDVSAILMTIISLTGLILLLFIKKKRTAGVALLFAGLILIYIIYHFWGQ